MGRAPTGTLLHTRRYLSYQGDRFSDASLLLRDDRGRLAACCRRRSTPVTSERREPPGLTYGGVVHDGGLHGERMLEAHRGDPRALRRGRGRAPRLQGRAAIYHRRPSDDDLYALVRAGASRSRRPVRAVDLGDRAASASRRTRAEEGAQGGRGDPHRGRPAPQLWPVLEDNLARRHGASPVHDVSEIQSSSRSSRARSGSSPACSTSGRGRHRAVRDGPGAHAQYIAPTSGPRNRCARPGVRHCIDQAAAEGAPLLRLRDQHRGRGGGLNAGLHTFKAEFGGGGVLYEVFGLPLTH